MTFDIDANGILNVAAKDKGTGKEQSISITGASTLDKNDVERMVREAEQNASSDKERREKIERKNQADSLAYQAEKQLEELGDKVPAADKTKVEGLVKEVREAVAQENDAQIEKLGVAETRYEFKCRDVPWNVSTRVWISSKIIFIHQISNARS